MAPRKTRHNTATNGANFATNTQPNTNAKTAFPPISSKRNLTCRTLLEDQVLLVDSFLTAEECKRLVHYIDSQSLELTPPKKKGEAERVNYRTSVTSIEIAQKLLELLSPHLPPFPYPASVKLPNGSAGRAVHSFNSNIRMYKYTPGQHFGPHYDDSVRDSQTGAQSEWTLLVYLTGVEDGVKGGETLFYLNQKKSKDVVTAPLTRGTVLLHRHGHECLLHEGSPVKSGTKYILRSDLMFMQ